MRDVRIITLHKQHYMNEYGKEPLRCQFSCWGYYDGLDIHAVSEGEYNLFQKKSNAPISETWFGLGQSVCLLQGRSSCQNIGIFRCTNSGNKHWGENFWKLHERMPLCGVVFLQLSNRNEYKIVSTDIENKFNIWTEEKKCCALSYCTFDNADLVILLQGNSVKCLEEIAQEIRRMESIDYSNAVIGVSEKYLETCGKKTKWKGIPILSEDQLAKIRLGIVSSGDQRIKEYIKKELEIHKAKTVTVFQMSGHEDLLIEICGTDVQTLLELMIENGFITHQNKLYGKYIYNITTSIILNEQGWGDISQEEAELKEDEFKSWFQYKIKYYVEEIDEILKGRKDQALYSYYQALLRTLNLLVQFEKFSMSKEIFYLIYPSFEMFEKHLKVVLEDLKQERENKDYYISNSVKEDMCSFLESVNSLIYHIIHTDQMFLMVPGYSGTSFSIPIKMCSLYAWLTQSLIKVLNDKKGCNYQCLLIPKMEAKPETSMMNSSAMQGDFLIKIWLSQRTLYMPRHLMMILSHEVAHYVGDKIRKRDIRAECLIKTMADAITETIIPRDICDNQDIFYDCFDKKRKKMGIEISRYLSERIKSKDSRKYHLSSIRIDLERECINILRAEDKAVYKEIFVIPEEVETKLKRRRREYWDNYQRLHTFQKEFDNNRKNILANGCVRKAIDILLKVYSEVFSDIVAMEVLQIDYECYEETFAISEGMFIRGEQETLEDAVRKNVAQYLSGKNNGIRGVVRQSQVDWTTDKMVNQLLGYGMTLDMLKKYVDGCRQEIKLHLAKDENKAVIDSVRRLFQIFNGKDNMSCIQIYDVVQQKINEYENIVEKSYQKSVEKLYKEEKKCVH